MQADGGTKWVNTTWQLEKKSSLKAVAKYGKIKKYDSSMKMYNRKSCKEKMGKNGVRYRYREFKQCTKEAKQTVAIA